MANGKVSTETEYDSYFWVKWSMASQDVVTNKTKINWSGGVYCGHSFYNNAIKMSAFTIDGVQVYNGGTYSNYSKGDHTIASGTMEILHNDDGTKELTISEFEGWLFEDHEYYFPGYTFSLPKINRYAAITEASDFTDLDNPSIKFVYYTGLDEQPITSVWLEPNLAGESICLRDDIENDGQYTWDLTDEERDTLRSKCAGNSCTVRIGIYSYIGDKRYSNYKDVKFTMTENDATRPNIVMDIKLNNGSLPSKFDDIYIQGKSKAEVKLTVSGKYGASIKSYSATVDGKEYANTQNFTSDVFQNPEVEIKATATDSRGFSGEAEKTLSVSEYSKPLLVPTDNSNAIMCYRSDSEGNKVSNSDYVWVKVERHFSSIQQINTCAIQWRKKETSEAWNDAVHLWSDLLPKSADGTQYSGLIEGGYFYNTKSYTIQLRAIDDVGEYDIKTFDVPTDAIALHLGKGGKSVSVGKYCDYSSEEPTFSSGWKAIFDSDVVVGGDIFVGKNKTPLKDYILSVINEGG